MDLIHKSVSDSERVGVGVGVGEGDLHRRRSTTRLDDLTSKGKSNPVKVRHDLAVRRDGDPAEVAEAGRRSGGPPWCWHPVVLDARRAAHVASIPFG